MLGDYINGDYDLENSFVLGDRLTDMLLAKNLGAKGIMIGKALDVSDDHMVKGQNVDASIALKTDGNFTPTKISLFLNQENVSYDIVEEEPNVSFETLHWTESKITEVFVDPVKF